MTQQQSVATPYPLSDFVGWRNNQQLQLTPKFQRRAVWSDEARSYLVDTVLRGLPMPPVFIRQTLDLNTRMAIREVVDGQQRLRAILDYEAGLFAVSATHNQDYGGAKFADLSATAQADFLAYKLDVHVLQNVPDAEVLGLFARLNTYTLNLNRQELRNAEFFGAFKQLVYELSLEHYVFWTANRIFNDRQIARMAEAEFVSELVLTMLEGIRSTRDADLKEAYKRYDKRLPDRIRLKRQFNQTIDLVSEIFAGRLNRSAFRARPRLFSMFAFAFDAIYGLPKSKHERTALTADSVARLRERLASLETKLKRPESGSRYEAFNYASRAATSDPGRRRSRHDFLWRELGRP